jgi:tetratricopeptide (TPR) repeat protein
MSTLPKLMCAVLMTAIASAATFAQEAALPPQQKEQFDPWREYVLQARWTDGAAWYRNAIVEMCKADTEPDFKSLCELHYGLNVCRYMPRVRDGLVPEKDVAAYTRWLLANRQFTEKLLLALSPADDAGMAFTVIHRLRSAQENAVKQFPILAITFAVVWDRYQDEPRDLNEAFAYFCNYSNRMYLDLRTTPPEVAKYIVDTQRPVEERVWAMREYGNRADIAKLYRTIWLDNYDYDAFLKGTPKKVYAYGTTLEDIRKHGGVCLEAAIFASEVGKAVGIPSVTIYGPSQGGYEHAWVGFLSRKNGAYYWDCETGRLADSTISSGRVLDPQSGATVSEHELAHALAVLRYPEDVRRRARIWCDVSRVLLEAGEKDRARKAIYLSLNAGVFDKQQWITYTEMAKQTDLPEQAMLDDLSKFCDMLKDYPNLAADAFESIVSAVDPSNEKLRLRLYSHMAEHYKDNAEIWGRVALLQGRYLESVGKTADALKVYSTAAVQTIKSRNTMLALLDNAGRVLNKQNATADAIEMHAKILDMTPKPPMGTAATISTTWFQVGLRLAKLYDRAGNRSAHDRILQSLMKLQRGSTEQLQAMSVWLSRLDYSQVNTTTAPLKVVP